MLRVITTLLLLAVARVSLAAEPGPHIVFLAGGYVLFEPLASD